MPLVSDIPMEAMRRMRLIAETNQLIQEKIEEEARKKEQEENSDEFASANELSESEDDDAPALYPSESFVEFLDTAIEFMTPKSKRKSEFTARNAYLMHNAKISGDAYDEAVDKVRSMPALHGHVTFAEDVEELAIDVSEAERVKTEEEIADEEVERMLNGSQGSDAYWWRNLLYKTTNYIPTPCSKPSSNLVTPVVAKTGSASSFAGLCTPKTPKTPMYGDWKL